MRITAAMVEAARQDPHAADQLYREVEDVRRELKRKLSGFLWLYRDCIEEALDAAFLKALRSYDTRLGGFRAWYYRIGLTESMYACRRERQVLQRLVLIHNMDYDGRPAESVDGIEERGDEPEHADDLIGHASRRSQAERDERDTMLAVRQALSASEWQLVELLMGGYTHRELRNRLGITRYQLDKRIQELREKLRSLLATY